MTDPVVPSPKPSVTDKVKVGLSVIASTLSNNASPILKTAGTAAGTALLFMQYGPIPAAIGGISILVLFIAHSYIAAKCPGSDKVEPVVKVADDIINSVVNSTPDPNNKPPEQQG